MKLVMETIALISSVIIMILVFDSITCEILTQSFVIRLNEMAQVIEEQKQVIEGRKQIIDNLTKVVDESSLKNIVDEQKQIIDDQKEIIENLNITQETMKEQIEMLNNTAIEHDSCLIEQNNKMAAINITLMSLDQTVQTMGTGKAIFT